VDVIFYIKSIAALALVLTLLVALLFYRQKNKRVTQKRSKEIKPISVAKQYTLNDIVAVVRDKDATTEELSEAIEYLVKHYGKIHPKLGMRAHPDFDIYSEIILRICRHPNTNKDIVLELDRELEKQNPEYAREIDDSLTKGLNSRGI